MKYFDKHPVVFRVILLCLALYLIGLGAVNTYYLTSSSTDENLFTTPPSTLYIVRGFPAEQSRSSSLQLPQQLPDSIRAGNLLTSIDGTVVHTTAEVQTLLEANSNTYLTLGIFSLRENTEKKYRVQRSALPGYFVRDIPPTAYVIEVVPGGASDQAGIRVGDLIVSINGQRFENILEADRIMRQGRAGISINYEILRNNTTLNLNLTLSRVRFPLPLFTVFLCGLFYMGTGLFIGLSRPNFAAARLVGLAFLTVGFLWIGSSYAGASIPMIITILRVLTIILTAVFSFPLWLHSSLHFPVEQPHLLQKKWLYRIPYFVATGSALLIIILSFLNSISTNFLLTTSVVFQLLYIVSVFVFYRSKFTPEYRRISKPLRLAGMLAPLAVVASLVILEIMPESRSVWTAILTPSFMAALPLSYLYIIGRYRLLNLNLRVRRTIQYTFLSFVWKASILIIAFSTLYLLTQLDLDIPNIRFTGVAVEIPKEPISIAERSALEKITLMLAAICFTFAFWEIGRAGQTYINRVYYRSDYDYRQAAADFADIFSTKFDLEELAAGIVQQTARSVHLRQAGILIFRDGSTVCSHSVLDGEQQQQEKTGIDGAALHRALLQFHGGFSANYLPRALKDAVHDNGYYHLVPIRSKKSTIGVIAIGEKLSEADVEREDLAFLESVSRQAAVAIENAFLYKEIAEQERLKHELAIAREIQLASLPQITPDVPGLDIAGLSCPALEVGGDYFDYLNGTPGSITVLVGDVSGKGTSAALYMSKVQGILRSLHAFNLSPKELFVRTNQLLFNDLEKRSYVTALSARFTPLERRINIARAGHLPLLHFDAHSGSIRRILPKGLGLGMVSSTVFSTRIDEEILSYNPGDIFLFVTDGVTEAMNEERLEFGDDRLQELLRTSATTDANTIRDTIHNAVREFTGTVALHDDYTIVVVKAV